MLRVIGGLDPILGGPPESAVAACIATQREGAQNTMVFASGEAGAHRARNLLARLSDAGADVHAFPVRPVNQAWAHRWGSSPDLLRWLGADKTHDVVHIHGALGAATSFALLAGVARRRPVVVSPHESLTDFDIAASRSRTHKTLKRLIRRLYVTQANSLVFASRLEAEGSGARELPEGRVLIAPHPVAGEELFPSPEPSGEAGVRIGFLGRFNAKKRIDVLIRALGALPAEFRLAIGGQGSSEEARTLQALTHTEGVAERVDWLGWLDARARRGFLRQIDMLAMPSQYECFGMAAAEALSVGVPVVVSASTGIAEVVRRNGGGLIAAGTPTAFADAIKTLASNPRDASNWRDGALRAARAELSYEAYGRSVVARYEALLEQATGRMVGDRK